MVWALSAFQLREDVYGEAFTFSLSFGAQDLGPGGSKLATQLSSSNAVAQWLAL